MFIQRKNYLRKIARVRVSEGRDLTAGLRLDLRVTPNAGADRIEGVEARDDGSVVLRVRVAAIADKGRANTAVTSRARSMLRSAIEIN